MKPVVRAAMAAALVLALALLPGLSLAAVPAEARVELLLPVEARVGDTVLLSAKVTDQPGAGLPGVEIWFRTEASFLNAQDNAEIGRSVTGATGVATLVYVPRSEGDITITVGLAADPPSGRPRASGVVKVLPGPAQHESEKAGLRVPGVGVWFLALLLGGVWGAMLWSLLQVRAIAGRGGREKIDPRWGPRRV